MLYRVCYVFILGLAAGWLWAQPEEPPQGEEYFQITPLAFEGKLEKILPVDFNQDNLKDILVLYRTHASERIKRCGLIVFQNKKNGFSQAHQLNWEFPVTVTTLALGDFLPAAGCEIAALSPDGVYCYHFNPQFSEPILLPDKLINIPLFFRFPSQENLFLWQLPLDIDNNGLNDLVLPTNEGYRIYLQTRPQEFNSVIIKQKVTKEVVSQHGFISLKMSLPNWDLIDLNGDKLKDFVFYQSGSLFYYLQSSAGDFPERPTGQMNLKPLQEELEPNKIVFSSLELVDINKDGITDLILSLISGAVENLSETNTKIFIYPGNPERLKDNQSIYATSPHQIINLKGVMPMMRLADANADGYPDLVTTTFELSLIKTALLRYIQVIHEVYLYQPAGGKFSNSPDYARHLNFPPALLGRGRRYFSHIYIGNDFNKDNRPDLLTISGPDKTRGRLEVLLGRPKAQLINPDTIGFYRDPYLSYPLEIPNSATVEDLNQDGKSDIILEYHSRLIILLSR